MIEVEVRKALDKALSGSEHRSVTVRRDHLRRVLAEVDRAEADQIVWGSWIDDHIACGWRTMIDVGILAFIAGTAWIR